MYLGVDVGGTKTLVATFSGPGVISEQVKFPTPKKYDEFLTELHNTVAGFKTPDFIAAGVGMPVTVFDRASGRGINFSNLPWVDVGMRADVQKICDCPVGVENDAKLAALSEAMLLKDTYRSVLYVTISTGIGIGLVVDGVLDTNVGDGGGRTMLVENNGTLTPWEDFAGGRAIAEHYGKKAMDITDKDIWQKISQDLAKGFIQLIALLQPEVIVIGGSVGTYFDRYGKQLALEIEKYNIPLVTLPLLREAKRPEEAVIYGCYNLAKQVL